MKCLQQICFLLADTVECIMEVTPDNESCGVLLAACHLLTSQCCPSLSFLPSWGADNSEIFLRIKRVVGLEEGLTTWRL